MAPPPQPAPEFSRLLSVDKISSTGQIVKLEATPKERQALAERFGLLNLSQLTAQLTVTPSGKNDGFNVTGKIHAEVTQQCVISLEPITATLDREVDVFFLASPESEEVETVDLTHVEEDFEPIEDGLLDLGEMVSQHLFLTLDPYPKKPGLKPLKVLYGEEEQTANPFAKLTDWPKKPPS